MKLCKCDKGHGTTECVRPNCIVWDKNGPASERTRISGREVSWPANAKLSLQVVRPMLCRFFPTVWLFWVPILTQKSCPAKQNPSRQQANNGSFRGNMSDFASAARLLLASPGNRIYLCCWAGSGIIASGAKGLNGTDKILQYFAVTLIARLLSSAVVICMRQTVKTLNGPQNVKFRGLRCPFGAAGLACVILC